MDHNPKITAILSLFRRIRASLRIDRLLILLALCLALVGLVECGRPAIDRSLLTDEVCRAPCWSGLIPGQSSERDVLLALQTSRWVAKGSVNRWGSTAPNGEPVVMIAWHDRRNEDANRATIHDNVLLTLDISLDYRPTLGELVDKFGPPDVFYVIGGRGGHRLLVVSPQRGLSFDTDYFASILESDVYVRPGVIEIRRELRVKRVVYYAPSLYENSLRDSFLWTPEEMERILSRANAWQGFGEVQASQ